MDQKFTRLIAIGIATVLSILLVSGIFLVIGSDDPGLQATFIAILSASIAVEVYLRLVSRFPIRGAESTENP